ncbi:MAG: DUF3160 domain-containing protein, partial [Myxococcales bacterium]|nr:DUF3160 domain-containing protein [Myxococcales bacterium]
TASLALPAPAAPARFPAWDGQTPPRWLDRIDAHLHLSPLEHARLREHGFVVLDRLPYASYAAAFHDVFQEELPLYVGVDPILHAVFRGTELALERVERRRLLPALGSMLKKLRTTLAVSGARFDAETRHDLDLLLGVAASLFGTHHLVRPGEAAPAASLFGQDDAVAELAGRAGQALEEVELFGRRRMIDFSQLEPRGHYTGGSYLEEPLDAYFRAVMWLARLELNLVSRGSRSSQPGEVPNPEETPREARVAMALAELVERSGAAVELRAFEEVYARFAGRREDVSPAELTRVMRAHALGWDAPFPALEAALGEGYRRTARTHFMPQGVRELPIILTVLGPRIVPDIAPLERLVHDAVPQRTRLGAPDVAYALGHDRARAYLADDLARHPSLGAELDRARSELARQASASRDVYGSWLRSVLALGGPPAGIVPSFMKSDAYADLRMGSALVGYGQLRHAFVVLAGQGYDAYGCEIPDAYVEPLPAFFDALVAHVKGLQATAPGWEGLLRTLTVLARIARDETTGAPLAEPERRWLGMVSEHVPKLWMDTGEPPKWTGWYFDMFEDRELGATAAPAFVADYFTLTNAGLVEYLGADGPRLAVFIVDVGGEPRAMVGPVAKGYETETPIAARLDDARALEHTGKTAPWRSSFAVAELPAPELGLVGRHAQCQKEGRVEARLALRSERALGPVTVTFLDHHGDPVGAPTTLDVGPGWRVVALSEPSEPSAPSALPLPLPLPRDLVRALHVRILDLAHAGLGTGAYDYFTSPSVFADKYGASPLPRRPQGLADFGIGAPVPQGGSPRGRPWDGDL